MFQFFILLLFLELSRGWEGDADSVEANLRSHELVDAINAYRDTEAGLPAIPYSESLAFVAQLHVDDSYQHPSSGLGVGCNMHSWSNDGPWTGMCYTSDHAQASNMWNKPAELSRYTSQGYEISTSASSASSCVSSWAGSQLHKDVIVNTGIWTSRTWRALGCAIGSHGYGHCWFGTAVDPGRTSFTCDLVVANDPNVCLGGAGSGVCEDMDNCKCWPGVECTIPCVPECVASHGLCRAGTCICSDGWGGVDCSELYCNGIAFSDASVCSGFGTCDGPNVCNCDSSHHGEWCHHQIYPGVDCYGTLSENPNVCSSVGTCGPAENQCVCDDGYSGVECEVVRECFGLPFTEEDLVCNMHGVCVGDDDCECVVGWRRANCTEEGFILNTAGIAGVAAASTLAMVVLIVIIVLIIVFATCKPVGAAGTVKMAKKKAPAPPKRAPPKKNKPRPPKRRR